MFIEHPDEPTWRRDVPDAPSIWRLPIFQKMAPIANLHLHKAGAAMTGDGETYLSDDAQLAQSHKCH